MFVVRFPDGVNRSVPAPCSAQALLADWSAQLASRLIGCRLDGRLQDLSSEVDSDCALAPVLRPASGEQADPAALSLLRHSAAHVLAQALEKRFPGVKLASGPAVEEGFYYDVQLPPRCTLRESDLARREVDMAAIVAADRAFVRRELGVEEGLALVRSSENPFKLHNACQALARGDECLSFYATGQPEHFEDLCEGPHVPSTGCIAAFKLFLIAAAHGPLPERAELTRIYGTAFFDQSALEAFERAREAAQQRDHRVVGRRLGLFALDDEVGQGLPLWKPKGAVVRQALSDFIGELLSKQGYQQVFTPHIGKLGLYRCSGHFPYYADSQYPPVVSPGALQRLGEEGVGCAELVHRLRDGEIDGYLLKPMNCPHHIRIYQSEPRSYRALPLRLCEFGTVYRYEQSGELNGLTRVRALTVDDAHIFCRPDQVEQELDDCMGLVRTVFDVLGFERFRVRVGLRDPDSNKFVGAPAQWDEAEAIIRRVAERFSPDAQAVAGEAAFYGPKIDFMVDDVLGRPWQLGTVQLDYQLPERFDLHYRGSDGGKHRPVIVHRTPLGSLERFVGLLIEHFAGAFPLWLSPVQLVVLPVGQAAQSYARKVHAQALEAGLRGELDDSDDRLGAKVRRAAEAKIPYQLVVGEREAQTGQVSLRVHGAREQRVVALDDLLLRLQAEVASRRLKPRLDAG